MNFNEEIFKIACIIKKFILESEKMLENIPRHDFYNRDKFRNDVTELLRLVYLANLIDEKITKKQYQLDICARISMLDFYLERAYILKYISEKQLYNYTKRLEIILKMTKGWIKSCE